MPRGRGVAACELKSAQQKKARSYGATPCNVVWLVCSLDKALESATFPFIYVCTMFAIELTLHTQTALLCCADGVAIGGGFRSARLREIRGGDSDRDGRPVSCDGASRLKKRGQLIGPDGHRPQQKT